MNVPGFEWLVEPTFCLLIGWHWVKNLFSHTRTPTLVQLQRTDLCIQYALLFYPAGMGRCKARAFFWEWEEMKRIVTWDTDSERGIDNDCVGFIIFIFSSQLPHSWSPFLVKGKYFMPLMAAFQTRSPENSNFSYGFLILVTEYMTDTAKHKWSDSQMRGDTRVQTSNQSR